MAERTEAQVQISRLLADPALRSASTEVVQEAVRRSLPRLAEGLVAEAAAADDVLDRESALAYLTRRLDFLAAFLGPAEREWLEADVTRRVEQW